MANSPSKVGREGAAFKTPNGQANDRVHEPHDGTIGVEESSSPFVHIQLKVINEAGAFSSSVLSKDFERLLLDDDN
ncbi:hypothetical protein N0V85_008892 [Neurospora sp. IMI 360204]|nr:hypothetical protein N0V85_008892 [Neurospora sp. IMI 360204]